MRKSFTQPRKVLAFAGVMVMFATIAFGTATVRPTEATWQDTAYGSSTFGVGENVGNHYARALSTFGVFSIPSGSENIGPAHEFDTSRTSPTPAPFDSRTLSFADRGILNLLNMTISGATCARTATGPLSACPGGSPAIPSGAASFASATATGLAVRTTVFPLARYPGTLGTTATCTPGQVGQTSIIKDGNFTLDAGLGSTTIAIPEATGNAERASSTGNRRGFLGAFYYTATITHIRNVGDGYAKSDLYLDLRAGSSIGGSEQWHLVIDLASAECGLDRSASTVPTRPITQTGIPQVLAQNARTASHPMAPRAADVDLGLPVQNTAGENSTVRDSRNSEEEDGEETSLPPLDDGDATVLPTTTSAPASDVPATPGVTPTGATEPPAAGDISTTKPRATDSGETTEPTEQTAVAEGPQDPESVRVGREFAVVNRDGVELGTAKVEDIVRTPGCGVELTLSITTSAEAGPDRWTSVAPDDFAEVRAGGSTREATTLNSDCEQAANSTTTPLSPGRDYEIVIAFQLDDSAQQAMLRPDGTAGWIFDLPPLPRVTATTSPAAPTTGESATTPTGTELTTTDVAEA